MKFRGSIYVDFFVEEVDIDKAREKAKEILRQIVAHISFPNDESLPEDYSNAYFGNVALISEILEGVDRL